MRKWCASEIKEQPGLIPQMTETAQPVLNLRHRKESSLGFAGHTCLCVDSCLLALFALTGEKVQVIICFSFKKKVDRLY